jgi:hypothetical protein
MSTWADAFTTATQTEDTATKWKLFQIAADEDEHPHAQFIIGLRYLQGMLVEKNEVLSFQYIRLAAKHYTTGNISVGMARNQLANMYAQGQGTSVDLVHAYKWVLLAEKVSGIETRKSEIAPYLAEPQKRQAESLAAACVSSGMKICD